MNKYFKKYRLSVCVIFIVLLISSCQLDTQYAEKNNFIYINQGLLLGLANVNVENYDESVLDMKPSNYRTLWITESGDKISCEEKEGGIITPYKNSLWELGNKEFNYSKLNEDNSQRTGDIYSDYEFYYDFSNIVSHLAIEKAKELYNIDTFRGKFNLDEEGDMGSRFKFEKEFLYFVGNNYACVINNNLYTGGGSFKWIDDNVKFYEINNLKNLVDRDKNIGLLDLLDDKEKKQVSDFATNYNKKSEDNKSFSDGQIIETKNLSLKRINGKWQILIPLYRMFNNSGNGTQTNWISGFVNLNIKLPESITSYDTLCLDWNIIKQKIPQAKDAVSSPNGDILAVLTPTELLIYKNPQLGMDEPSLKIKVNNDECIIQNQWVSGEKAKNWDDILKSLK